VAWRQPARATGVRVTKSAEASRGAAEQYKTQLIRAASPQRCNSGIAVYRNLLIFYTELSNYRCSCAVLPGKNIHSTYKTLAVNTKQSVWLEQLNLISVFTAGLPVFTNPGALSGEF